MSSKQSSLLSFFVLLLSYFVRALEATETAERNLHAATRDSLSVKRSERLEWSNATTLIYAEGRTTNGRTSTFAAEMLVKSERPMLILEQHEHLMDEVYCTTDTVTISLATSAPFDLRSLEGGFVVTSHYSCNAPGERQPYHIHNIDDKNPKSIVFTVEPVRWRDTFDLHVDLGHHQDEHTLRSHIPFRRRDPYRRRDVIERRSFVEEISSVLYTVYTGSDVVTAIAFSGSTFAESIPFTPSNAASSAPPSQRPSRSSSYNNLPVSGPITTTVSSEVYTIFTNSAGVITKVEPSIVAQSSSFAAQPPSSSAFVSSEPPSLSSEPSASSVASSSSAAPSATTTNAIDLQHSLLNTQLLQEGPLTLGCVNCTTYGTLDIEWANIDIDPIDVKGTAGVVAQGMGAYIHLSTKLAKSYQFTAPIPDLGISKSVNFDGISITLAVGLYVAGGYKMNADIGITYGFDMQIPDGAEITLNLGSPESSSINGFDNTISHWIQPQSHASLSSMTFWVALRTGVQLTVGDAGKAGVYLDVPKLSAKLSIVDDVDANCQPAAKGSDNSLDEALSIRTTAVGDWAWKVDLLGDDNHHNDPFAATSVVPVMCLSFDEKSGSYITAEKAVKNDGHVLKAAPLGWTLLAVGFVLLLNFTIL